MRQALTPALARIKRKVREAIHVCGGVDGAGATADRGRSVAGDWNNINHPALPPVDCAFAMDEVAVAQGFAPPILSAMAFELGHVVIRLPDAGSGDDAVTGALIDASAEFGDIAHAVREATRDGDLSGRERDTIVSEIDEALAKLAILRAVVTNGQDSDVQDGDGRGSHLEVAGN